MGAGLAEVVVLGAGGFAGSAILRALETAALRAAGIGRAECDLERKGSGEYLAMRSEGRVLIYAARGRTDGSEERMAETVAAALGRAKPERLVWLSTLSVYDDTKDNLKIDERTPVSPQTPYGRAKARAEALIREACAGARVPLLVLRPCKMYGPGGSPQEYGPASFIAAAKAGRPARVYGEGEELRDHLFAPDLGRAVVGLLEGGAEGVVNVASGRSRAIAEIVALVGKLAGKPLIVERLPRTRPKADLAVDVSRLRALAPGLTLTDLPQGLEETWRR